MKIAKFTNNCENIAAKLMGSKLWLSLVPGDEHGYALPTGIALLLPCRPSSRYVAPLIATSPLSSLRRPSSRHVAPLVAMSPL
ncbi:hypothetical protein BYT27DRAFT_7258040 [Phlegmacium glaucopus]|nr:hypothetical protein BYT27DRAFT_7258040 [Phlegmacium glaucopus]